MSKLDSVNNMYLRVKIYSYSEIVHSKLQNYSVSFKIAEALRQKFSEWSSTIMVSLD